MIIPSYFEMWKTVSHDLVLAPFQKSRKSCRKERTRSCALLGLSQRMIAELLGRLRESNGMFATSILKGLPVFTNSKITLIIDTEKRRRAASASAQCKTDTGDFHCIYLYNLKPLLMFHSFHAVQFRERILRLRISTLTFHWAARRTSGAQQAAFSLSGRRYHASMRQL